MSLVFCLSWQVWFDYVPMKEVVIHGSVSNCLKYFAWFWHVQLWRIEYLGFKCDWFKYFPLQGFPLVRIVFNHQSINGNSEAGNCHHEVISAKNSLLQCQLTFWFPSCVESVEIIQKFLCYLPVLVCCQAFLHLFPFFRTHSDVFAIEVYRLHEFL